MAVQFYKYKQNKLAEKYIVYPGITGFRWSNTQY
jgi:hypothetical protein